MNKSKFDLHNHKTKTVGALPEGDPQKRNTQSGITLVALIITIIVLLILAMVSIRLIMNGGIIDRAEKGTSAYSEAEVQEQIKLAYSEWQTAVWDETAGDAAAFMQARLREALNNQTVAVTESSSAFTVTMTVNGAEKQYTFNSSSGQTEKVKTVADLPATTATTSNSAVTENSKYTVDGKTAVIPAGYAISNETNEQSIDTGLVIKKDGNEWVWIPVSSSDLAAMYTEDSTGWTMSGTGGETGIDAVVTKYKSNGNIISEVTRDNPGTTDWREPDVLNSNSYDKNATNLSNAGLGANIGEAATTLRDDYKAMIDSVKKYGGFYVGRYELSNAGIKKNQASLKVNWYNIYAKCKTLGSDSVETRMIWGCQWDQVCKFISTAKDANGDPISLTDSSKYGNYRNSQAPANTGNYSSGTTRNTGSNEAWKTNNIYDLAGNCWEWTQEVYNPGSGYRAIRGGNYDLNGDNGPVTYRSGYYPASTYGSLSSRPTLYIK